MKFLKSYSELEKINEAEANLIATFTWNRMLNYFDNFYNDDDKPILQIKETGFIDEDEDIKTQQEFIDNYILNPKSIYFDQRYVINKHLFIYDKKEAKHLDDNFKTDFIYGYLSKGHFSKALLKRFKKPNEISYPIGIENIKTFQKNVKILESFLKKYGLERSVLINNALCLFQPLIDEHVFQAHAPNFVFNTKGNKVVIDEADHHFYDYGHKRPRSKFGQGLHGETYMTEYEEIPSDVEFDLSPGNSSIKFFNHILLLYAIENNFKKINSGKLKKFFKDYPDLVYEIIDEEISAYTQEDDGFTPNIDTETYPELVSFLLMEYDELESYIMNKFRAADQMKKILKFTKHLSKEVKKQKFAKLGNNDFGFFESYDSVNNKEDLLNPHLILIKHRPNISKDGDELTTLYNYGKELSEEEESNNYDNLDIFLETCFTREDGLYYLINYGENLRNTEYENLIYKHMKIFPKYLKQLKKNSEAPYYKFYDFLKWLETPAEFKYAKEIINYYRELIVNEIINNNDGLSRNLHNFNKFLDRTFKSSIKLDKILVDIKTYVINDKKFQNKLSKHLEKNSNKNNLVFFKNFKEYINIKLNKKFNFIRGAVEFGFFEE